VGAELWHADAPDRRTDMKLVVTFRNFGSAPKNRDSSYRILQIIIAGTLHWWAG